MIQVYNNLQTRGAHSNVANRTRRACKPKQYVVALLFQMKGKECQVCCHIEITSIFGGGSVRRQQRMSHAGSNRIGTTGCWDHHMVSRDTIWVVALGKL
jgi:hypothetical protein